MRAMFCFLTLLILAGLSDKMLFAQQTNGNPGPRQVAITIDDLPVVSRHFRDNSSWQRITDRLIAQLTADSVPAIGFVNESKLHRDEVLDENRVALLQQWLDAGLELGNHTFSHPSLHNVSVAEYTADLLKGEAITRPLIAAAGRQMTFFRHPYLHTGQSLTVKAQIDSFLAAHSYRIAPVSMDNSEWVYAFAYDRAASLNDSTLMRQIGDAYVQYMSDVFAYYEQQSVALLGYELKQILLLHANFLNANYLSKLLEILKKRGYRFIPLEAALDDPAYRRADTYTGRGGITWLHRWALAEGKSGDFFAGEPEVHAFVQTYFDRHLR